MNGFSLSFLQRRFTSPGALEDEWHGGDGCSVRGSSSPIDVTWVLMLLVALGVWLGAGVARAQVDCSATGTTGVSQTECEVLMALYVSANGASWTDSSNWDTASAVSTWFGVGASGGRVTGLSLGNNQLAGAIPPELGKLQALTTLQLSDNTLAGAIPPELGELPNLTSLWLQGNQLTGPIPPELGNLSSLQTLYLHNNLLTDAIPPELGDLVNLRTLHLSNNDLTGSVPPELGGLTNLIGLYVYGNQLTGSIPRELGKLINLTTLHLAGNQLAGEIPAELESLASLTALYLYGNQLTGPIPPWIGNLTNLRTIYLGNNQLTGALPPELGNLVNLVSLFVYGNQIRGPLPAEFGKLVNLTTLYLPNCQLTGPIPPELGNLTNLGTLFLSSNELTGPIPPELGNLTNLTTAYLQSNQLTGSVPRELENLVNLDTLSFSNNQLSGDIPDFTALPLTSLRFNSNAFVFADFESEFAAYDDGTPETFQYSPQAPVDTARTESFPTGAAAVLPSAVAVNPSGNDQYQWFKDGVAIAAPYGTARDLDVTLGSGGVRPGHAGAYRYTITNAVVTGLTLSSQVITVVVSATCGDGFVNDPSEVCDDGNLATGDGCNAACLLEVGETCSLDADCASNRCNMLAAPPVCAPPFGCGNGDLEAGEACDDGNNSNGDGCTASCTIEDGNPCNADAECASGICDLTEARPLCEPAGSCGNGVNEVFEACDDGNEMGGDGCSRVCLLETGEPCTNDADCDTEVCDGMESNTCEPANTCGNGALEGDELCDDGNVVTGDGCDAQCLLEIGAGPCTDGSQCASGVCNTMAETPVCAIAIGCGNGVLNEDESCDDGNLTHGDGCSQFCAIENAWRGGGGCGVGRASEGGELGAWAVLLLLGWARRRRTPLGLD